MLKCYSMFTRLNTWGEYPIGQPAQEASEGLVGGSLARPQQRRCWRAGVRPDHTAGMRATGSFVILCWVVFAGVWAISALSTKPALERQPLPGRWLALFLFALALMFLAMRSRWVPLERRVLPQWPVLDIVADSLVFLGLLVALWARAVLGRNWSGRVTFKRDHELIQRGPYRWVRHPIYSGVLLMVSGTDISVNRVSVFLGLALCACAVWVKLRQEEALMTKHFPESYPRYKARTKALIPFVL